MNISAFHAADCADALLKKCKRQKLAKEVAMHPLPRNP
jgi:hypothetical protein